MVFCISDAVASDLSAVLYGGIGKVRKTLKNRRPSGCAQKRLDGGLKTAGDPRRMFWLRRGQTKATSGEAGATPEPSDTHGYALLLFTPSS
jgi:hypothetical protein